MLLDRTARSAPLLNPPQSQRTIAAFGARPMTNHHVRRSPATDDHRSFSALACHARSAVHRHPPRAPYAIPTPDLNLALSVIHGALDRNTQKMPFKTRRSSTRGTPRTLFIAFRRVAMTSTALSAERTLAGVNGIERSHTSVARTRRCPPLKADRIGRFWRSIANAVGNFCNVGASPHWAMQRLLCQLHSAGARRCSVL
jgi:hypothetical protein